MNENTANVSMSDLHYILSCLNSEQISNFTERLFGTTQNAIIYAIMMKIAKDDDNISLMNRQRQEMMDVAEKYFRILREPGGTSDDELGKLEDQFNELMAPFSDFPAFMALLKLERELARAKK